MIDSTFQKQKDDRLHKTTAALICYLILPPDMMAATKIMLFYLFQKSHRLNKFNGCRSFIGPFPRLLLMSSYPAIFE